MAQTRNQLKDPEQHKLNMAIQNEWDSYIIVQRPTLPAAAEYFSKRLNMKVTEHNVSRAVGAIGKQWHRESPAMKNILITSDNESIKALANHQFKLTLELDKVLIKLGMGTLPFPGELLEIIAEEK